MFCFQNEGEEEEEEEEDYQELILRIRRGPWRPVEIMPTIKEAKNEVSMDQDEEDVDTISILTLEVRLNLTPFVLHTR